ncbi:MAG TPA: hypothetical protein VF625_10260 [Longimicrobium sp.]|jgi:hypothetical protein
MTHPTEYRPRSRAMQRVGGVLILAAGVVMAWIAWTQASRDAHFSFRGAFAGPAFAVLGLGLIFFPGYREERIARGEDITGMEGMALLTPRWWGILVGCLAAGALYTLALRDGWLR